MIGWNVKKSDEDKVQKIKVKNNASGLRLWVGQTADCQSERVNIWQ